MNEIKTIEKKYAKENLPEFKVGDRVKVSLKVKEGEKTRTQNFEGIVIRKRGSGINASFTVFKKTRGSSFTVEKTFPIHSPVLEKVKVIKANKSKRAKLYYLRNSTTKKFG